MPYYKKEIKLNECNKNNNNNKENNPLQPTIQNKSK